MLVPPKNPAVRAELRDVLSRFVRTGEDSFEGAVFPGPALVGPKGRVHGGLHPAIRLFAPMQAMGLSETLPVHVEVGMRSALPLSVETSFSGTVVRATDGIRVETRFGSDGKLDAYATSILGPVDLEAFAREWRACSLKPEVKNILARGSVPTRIGRHTISVAMDEAFFATGDNELRDYRVPDGSFDEAFASVVLDLLGAIGIGATHLTHVFTTHLSLDFHVRRIPSDVALLGLASLDRMHADTTSHLRPVDVRGTLVPPTCVPVLLTDAAMRTPYVSGVATVLPVRGALVTR